MDDERIIELLFDRQEAVLLELENKYGKLYKGIIRNFVDEPEDIKECENDFLLAVWESIPPNKPNSLPAYLSKIARRIAVNRLKYNKRQKRNRGQAVPLSEVEECLPAKPYLYDDDGCIGRILSDFLLKYDVECRVLFVRRYFYGESVNAIAERYNLKESVVSVKLFRMRKKLKKILEKEVCYERT